MSLTFQNIIKRADEIASKAPVPLVLMGASEGYALKAVAAATAKGWIEPTLVRLIDKTLPKSLSKAELIAADSDYDLVVKAVAHAKETGGILMHGRVDAVEMLRHLVDIETGYRPPKQILTHIGFIETERSSQIWFITDGGLVVKPTLAQKAEIVQNAVDTARKLGIERPKVAMLAAVESVYLQMQAVLDDAVIAKMGDRGHFGNAAVDGPLSFDVAVIEKAAQEKKITGEVAGKADILVAPGIETAVGLFKTLFMFSNARSAGVVVGGFCPTVLTSRSQNVDSSMNSIAIAMILNS